MLDRKRILIITDTFPPAVGGGGTIRMVKFAKYFSLEKWKVAVLTTNVKRLTAGEDKELYEEIISNHIKVRRVGAAILNIGERLKRILGRKEGNLNKEHAKKRKDLIAAIFAVPDSLNICIPEMVWAGLRLIRKEKINFILATSPSFSILVVGYLLKKLSGKHLIVDIRDDWAGTCGHSYNFGFRRVIDFLLERMIIRASDMVMATSEGIRSNLLNKHPMISHKKIKVIVNGYDPQDFEVEKPRHRDNGNFVLSYLGVLNYIKTPQYIFKGLKKAIQREPQIADHIKLRLVGRNYWWIEDLIRKEGLQDFMELTGFVSHKRSIQYMLDSDILVLILFNEEGAGSSVPGKLYEYLAAKKPILACICAGDAKNIMTQQRAGKVVPPWDTDSIAGAIIDLYQQWSKGKLKYMYSSAAIEQYSRERIVSGLIDLLMEIKGNEGINNKTLQ